jgi:hypothetical protein
MQETAALTLCGIVNLKTGLLMTPQERENMVALVYRANAGDKRTRLVRLKAQKCSCLAFQDHKIPCRHAIAVCRFFNARPENYITKFYEISEYREQYKYSLLPVLLDDLEPDGVAKPPPDVSLRGRPTKKRMKRKTRETEARRVGNLVLSNGRKEQQNEAQNRYQSGVTYSSQLDPLSIAQPLAPWQRIRAIQARLEAEAIEPHRIQAVNENKNNKHD